MPDGRPHAAAALALRNPAICTGLCVSCPVLPLRAEAMAACQADDRPASCPIMERGGLPAGAVRDRGEGPGPVANFSRPVCELHERAGGLDFRLQAGISDDRTSTYDCVDAS